MGALDEKSLRPIFIHKNVVAKYRNQDFGHKNGVSELLWRLSSENRLYDTTER